jgi:pimeloyl-ACP methyl ester carboxylesterase
MWRDIAPALAERFSVVCADLRGYGGSGCPPSAGDHAAYSKRALARDMVAVMSRLGFERFSIAGHDMGGRVAYLAQLQDAEHLHAICEEYRAAAGIDRADRAAGRRIACPVLALWSAAGTLASWYAGSRGTHRPLELIAKRGGTSYTFVTGLADAISQARTAAAGKDVLIAGGLSIAREAIAHRLVDELSLHVAPVLIGNGARLFDAIGHGQIAARSPRRRSVK